VSTFSLQVNVDTDEVAVADLTAERNVARSKGDRAEADLIRSALDAMGYVVEDGPDGTVARRQR
jgi:cysteinyl-tRNA synthetase